MLRKIKTKEQTAKKKHRDQIFIGTMMIGLLIVSTLGYSLISSAADKGGSKTSELGIEFIRENNLWKTTLAGEDFAFQSLPSEISNVTMNGTFNLGEYSNKPLYIVSPNEGAPEILSNIGRYVLRYQQACLNNETCTGDFPTKTCDSNLIIFTPGNETMVYQNESCVYISGDAAMGADAFLYKVLGIN
ncbi:MAG: hypothetical protein OEL87_00640 [Nanoarchaeota archaeon]|nr:hypothetical protein [Nanoarchaeota archaeon]